MRFFKHIPLFVLLFFLSPPVQAQDNDTPMPAQHPARVLEQKKKETENKKAELESQAKQINTDMEKTKKDLVGVAGEVKEVEGRLNELDARIRENEGERAQIEKRLRRDKSAIGDLVLALERLDRMPPEAMLARPGAPLETAQSAMLLQSILPDIYGRAEGLKKDLKRLDEIVASLQDDQKDVQENAKVLKSKQDEMAALLKKRKGLYDQTQQEIRLSDKALQDIAAQAKDLKDLVAKIEQKRQEEERTALSAQASGVAKDIEQSSISRKMRATPIPSSGAAQLPVSGMIRVGYKQTDDIGAESQGLTIDARPSALVVAPMGGVVRYAGYFKNYGKIIIVEHQKDYHSLIAGLSKIDTVVGQSVSAGEPIGSLPKTSTDGGKPSLYYELRLSGEPVNPARKFAGL